MREREGKCVCVRERERDFSERLFSCDLADDV